MNKKMMLDRIYRIKQDKNYLINPVNPVKIL